MRVRNALVFTILIFHHRPQLVGDIIPDVTNTDKEAAAALVIEEQPSPNATFPPQMPVTKQPELIERPVASAPELVETIEPTGLKMGQPTAVKLQADAPVMHQPKPGVTEQPEPIVMFGRGVASKADRSDIQEPAQFVIRKVVALNGRTSPPQSQDELAQQLRQESRSSGVEFDGVASPSKSFNAPADRFLKQQREYKQKFEGSQQMTVSTHSIPPQDDDDVFTMSDVAGTLNGIIGATANAASAVIEGVSSAFSPGHDLPEVRYQDDQVTIARPDDKVEGIPRPLEVC